MFLKTATQRFGHLFSSSRRDATKQDRRPRAPYLPALERLEDRLALSATPLRDLSIAAHEDDTILFMNPDLHRSIAAGNTVESIFLTAGDKKNSDLNYVLERENGAKAAYAVMAGVPDTWTETNQNSIHIDTLNGTNVTLIFLRLHASADQFGLLSLPGRMNIGSEWHYGEDPTVVISDFENSRGYTKQQLIDTLAQLIDDFHPDIVRTQDSSGYAGPILATGDPSRYGNFLDGLANVATPYDHSEHYYSAIYADAALQEYQSPYELFEYRGYNISGDIPNVDHGDATGADLSLKAAAFAAYAPHDLGLFTDPSVNGVLNDPNYGNWLRRQYLVEQGVATSTTLSASSTTLVSGQSVVITATVTDPYGAPVTAGTVSLQEGETELASSQTLDSSGRAVFTVSLSAGVHHLRAVYSGVRTFHNSADPGYTGSAVLIPPLDASFADQHVYPTIFPYLTVTNRTSAASIELTVPIIAASAGPTVVMGTGVPLTASATLSGGHNATGVITFALYGPGGNLVDTETTTVSGDGTYTTPHGYLPSAAGTYQWVASYSGDANNLGASTSSGSTPEFVVGKWVTVAGSALYLVGGNTNDQVNLSPIGSSGVGSTGIKVSGRLNGTSLNVSFSQAFAAIYVFGFGGNDQIQMNSKLAIDARVSEGNGNDNVQLGNGSNIVTLGNGKDSVHLGNGNNMVTLGNGQDTVRVGDGNNVIVAGTGNNDIQAGNGNNLVAGGPGRDHLRVGNGRNILIDGSVQLTRSGDSLAQVLSDWVQYGPSTANVADIRARLRVTYNTKYANKLEAGSGLDWFWATFDKDHTNRKPTDVLN